MAEPWSISSARFIAIIIYNNGRIFFSYIAQLIHVSMLTMTGAPSQKKAFDPFLLRNLESIC